MIPQAKDQPTMTAAEVMAALGLSRDAVYDAARRHELGAVWVGRRVLFSTAEIRRLLGWDL
jgi:excisionase family DNA binding protein